MAVATEAHNAWNFSGLAFLPTLQGHVRLVAVCGVGYRQPGLNRLPTSASRRRDTSTDDENGEQPKLPRHLLPGGRETENTDPRGNDPDG